MAIEKYKIRLSSGRVIGPIPLDKIIQLILKKHVTGEEMARLYPDGEWRPLRQFSRIADLLLLDLEGKLGTVSAEKNEKEPDTQTIDVDAQTVFLVDSEGEEAVSLKEISEAAPISAEDFTGELTYVSKKIPFAQEKTEYQSIHEVLKPEEKNAIEIYEDKIDISEQEQEARTLLMPGGKRKTFSEKNKKWIKIIVVGSVLGFLLYDHVFEDSLESTQQYKEQVIYAQLPDFSATLVDVEKSDELYQKAVQYYLQDNVISYQMAAKLFHESIKYNIENVKSLALLASTYLNLVDASNKDENYFKVVTELVDRSKKKSIFQPEVVISEVEFFLISGRSGAAQERLTEYTKKNPDFPDIIYYYLARVMFEEQEYHKAADFIFRYPEDKVFSPKLFYLKAMISKKLGGEQEALDYFKRAIQVNSFHAKSYLEIVDMYFEKGTLEKSANEINFLVKNYALLAPYDQARAFFFSSKLNQKFKKETLALSHAKLAHAIDKENYRYRLEYYKLEAERGNSEKALVNLKQKARMYYFIELGEERMKENAYHEALNQFLKAKDEATENALPRFKLAEAFTAMNDLVNARFNYEKAINLSPEDLDIRIRYIENLIKSYEWEKAEEEIEKAKVLTGSKSSLLRLAGDIDFQRKKFKIAIQKYQKAMKYKEIDSRVYTSYARLLNEINSCEEAMFFYAIIKRNDPFNQDGIAGQAECLSKTKGPEDAIRYLRSELSKPGSPKDIFFTQIAIYQIQKGEWELAKGNLEEAQKFNSEFALPWKYLAQYYQQKNDRSALKKALEAYKSYSDRNPADPSGYLERYRLYIQLGDFENANQELDRVYLIFPKYPRLHFFRGVLYSKMKNPQAAKQEFLAEVAYHAEDKVAQIELGKALIETGETLDARDHFAQAMQLDQQDPEPKQWAGWVNYLLKNYDGAVALLSEAAKYDKGNPLIQKRLGLAYYAQGKFQQASQAFRRYLELAPDAPDRREIERYL